MFVRSEVKLIKYAGRFEMSTIEIEQKIKQLPNHLLPEIMDYIDFLMSRYGQMRQPKNNFTFEWEGGLADLANQFTAVELQHQAINWRS